MLLQFTLGELPGSPPCMQNLHVLFLVHTGTYLLYSGWHVPVTVLTSKYRYIQVRTICLIPGLWLSRYIGLGFQMTRTSCHDQQPE